MVRHCLGKCIKPGLVQLPLCHKVNLLSCVARRPLRHKVNLPSCVVRQPLCNRVNLPRSSAAPFDHDLWYFRHQTNEHFNSMLFIRKKLINQPTEAPLSSQWNQHARPNYWKSYWREPHAHSIEGFGSLNSDVKAVVNRKINDNILLIQCNSFCQQGDDWILLKITEKIIRWNVFEERKRNPG